MDSGTALEYRCADAWPALVDQPLGQWRLRAAGGFTGRANGALALGDPGMPVAAALVSAVEFARAQRIEPLAHVIAGSATERRIAEAGWVVATRAAGAESAVLVGELTELAKRARSTGQVGPDDPAGRAGVRAGVHADAPPGWWPLVVDTATPTPAQRHVLTTGRVGYGLLEIDGHAVGAVRGALVDGYLHVARLAVRPEHRRQGLARRLLAALAGWARERGATHYVLQVTPDNAPAVRLYESLGAAEHHRYRYWVPR
ncbi:GNAT family N-acetyltransferase [Goodfellowiella coeruleoviolacea]|uniref:Acetyltransferase (GNAT) family protein n=1 Tax=Goodfellowiella coeruleoviolacea TaxID=334858 RepID=A0AAE3GE15_9PSEU|nr:GNAT family N-acetyltransferase [Goodfellowiella coeruleoviolacea]MCP2165624.1 Acetyltransferase (GNAT) family protein [Goodfellowiella coeruleoviolacea]